MADSLFNGEYAALTRVLKQLFLIQADDEASLHPTIYRLAPQRTPSKVTFYRAFDILLNKAQIFLVSVVWPALTLTPV